MLKKLLESLLISPNSLPLQNRELIGKLFARPRPMTALGSLMGYDAALIVLLVGFTLFDAVGKLLKFGNRKEFGGVIVAFLALMAYYLHPLAEGQFWVSKFTALLAMNPVIAFGVTVSAIFLALSSFGKSYKSFNPRGAVLIAETGLYVVILGTVIAFSPLIYAFLFSFQLW